MAPVRRPVNPDSLVLKAPLRERLGRYLVTPGIITETQRTAALQQQRASGGVLGQILVEMGACSREDIGGALAEQEPLTSIDLRQLRIDPQALKLITREGCLENRMLPFERFGTLLCLAMANPRDRGTLLTVQNAIETPVKAFQAPWEVIRQTIEEQYG